MSSQVREMITGITGFRPDGEVNGSYYQAAAGQLPGKSAMCAAVLAYVSADVQDVGIACGLFGNLNSGTFKGWEIGVNSLGQPYASYGDGASIVTIDGGELEPARWALIVLSLDTQNNRFALFVNGQLQAENVGALNALVPSTGSARVGASSNTSGPYTWSQLIAGCAYLDNSTVLDTEVIGYWEQTRRSGQVIPRNDAFYISPTFQNVWQSAMYNDGAHPPVGATKSDALATWPAAVGTLALTQVTTAGVLQVTQTSSEWSSVDGGQFVPPPPASRIPYTPAVPTDWGSPPPTTVAVSLDDLALYTTALAKNFIEGFQLSWVSNTTLSVAEGSARSGTGTRNFVSTAAATPIDLATVGAGGLDVGALAAATPYALWCLSGAGGTTIVASKAFTYAGVALPAGYDVDGRRVGSFMSDPTVARVNPLSQDGSGNVRRVRTWSYPNYDNSILVGGGALVATAIDCSAFVPPSASQAFVEWNLVGDGAGGPTFGQWGMTGSVDPTANNPFLVVSATAAAAGEYEVTLDWIHLDSNKKFDYVTGPLSGPATPFLTGFVFGYEESL